MARWRNWAGDQRCRPAVLARPRTVAGVADAVRAARGTVRVAGAGHSFGDLVATDGTPLDLRALTGLRAVDSAAGLVRVAAGTRLRVLNALRDLHALGARHEVTLPVEVRFVAGDEESFLSPAWGRDTVYLAAHAYRGTAWEGYFRGVQDIALAHDGRPHWGKRHGLDAAALADRYPAWERFRAVGARLDPGCRFANPHVRRVLGVEGARPCASTS